MRSYGSVESDSKKGKPKRIWIITTSVTNVLEKPLQKVFHKNPPKNPS